MMFHRRIKQLLVLLAVYLCYFPLIYLFRTAKSFPSFAKHKYGLQTSDSERLPPYRLKGESLRHLVHLKVNGSSKRDIVYQYRSQLNDFFRNMNQQLETVIEDDSVYRGRSSHVERACKNNQRDIRIKPLKNKYMYTEVPPVLYCPVAKVGSTFWGKVLSVIKKGNQNIHSPFQILYGKPGSGIDLPALNISLGETLNKLLSSRNKFVFTREPYHRIFSVFIDKFLSPNAYLWNFGKQAILKFRSNISDVKNISGSNVKFHEYIKYININDKTQIDDHLRSVTNICDVCNFKFDVIGKVETFERDVKFILNRIGVLNKAIVINDMILENDINQLVGSVNRAFSLKKNWIEYISVQAGMQRLWRQLQINGLIDMADPYPFSLEESHNVTQAQYTNVALEAFRRSSPAAKRTKREAFLKAYSMVEPTDLEQLRKGYLSDLEMFGYEQRPSELFDMDRNRKFDYDYFDVMQFK